MADETRLIPRLAETGAGAEKKAAELANLMIELLENTVKSFEFQKRDAAKAFSDVDMLARESGIYSMNGSAPSEFMLCSYLFRLRLLISAYRSNMDKSVAEEIYSIYPLAKQAAIGMDKQRLRFYLTYIKSIHKIIVSQVYPHIMWDAGRKISGAADLGAISRTAFFTKSRREL